jgi:hypothetical protein
MERWIRLDSEGGRKGGVGYTLGICEEEKGKGEHGLVGSENDRRVYLAAQVSPIIILGVFGEIVRRPAMQFGDNQWVTRMQERKVIIISNIIKHHPCNWG